MKAVTEFPNFLLTKAVATKATLTAEGKTPEEIQTSLGESFKFEGDKLKHFVNAIDTAAQYPQDLKRVLVMSLNEGEATPAKANKVEEFYYVPDFMITAKSLAAQADHAGGKNRRGGKGGKGGDRKGSPWGLSPEEKAAKNNKGAVAKPN